MIRTDRVVNVARLYYSEIAEMGKGKEGLPQNVKLWFVVFKELVFANIP